MLQQMRIATRRLRKQPTFTAVAVLALALGIGANISTFTVVATVVFRPLPWKEPDRLVQLWETKVDENKLRERASPANVLDWDEMSQTLEAVAFWRATTLTIENLEEPEEVGTALVSSSFFCVFGVSALAGRVLGDGEANENVVVIGAPLARRLFESPQQAVGQRITLEREVQEIVGVMPDTFVLPGADVEIWKPTTFQPGSLRMRRSLEAAGRLAPGVTEAQAREELKLIASRLAVAYPDTNQGWSIAAVPIQEEIVGPARRHLLILLSAAGCLFCIACTNVSALCLARATARSEEFAIRQILGATRGRLFQMVFAEGLILAALATLIAFLSSRWALYLLVQLGHSALPRLREVSIGSLSLAFTFMLALVTAVVSSLAPMWWIARGASSGGRVLTAGGAETAGKLKALIIVEIALSCVLLAGAGLLIRSLIELRRVDPGYRTEDILVAVVNLDRDRYRENNQRESYFAAAIESLSALPGVESAAATTALPLSASGIDFDVEFEIEGKPATPGGVRQAMVRVVSEGYFDTLGIGLEAGRVFEKSDRGDAEPVVIVNETLANREWGLEPPVGQLLRVFGAEHRVIGVARDTRAYGLSSPPRPEIYLPLQQKPWYPSIHLVAKTRLPARSLERAVRGALLGRDPLQPAAAVTTMEELLTHSLGRNRLLTGVLSVLGGIATLLTISGIYGVVSFGVSRRVREFGLRIALGAGRRDILTSVVAQGLSLAVAGLAIGLVVAWASSGLLRGLVFGIGPDDPLTLALVALVFLCVAVLASLEPALRASRLDPNSALAEE